jgi:uncharacterized protein involved in type VI secretion and phage assembly
MSALDLFATPASDDRSRFYGVVTAVVTNNQDPDQQGKVKIKLPGMTDDETGPWARVAVLMGGANRGTFFLPEQGDEVLVAFDNGNLKLPYVIGGLWNGQDTPPDTNSDGQNNKRFIKSRSGHLIRLDDTQGSEKLEIIDKSGNNSITFDAASNTITITAAQDITISAPQGTLTLNATTISISSTEDGTIAATGNLTLQASSKAALKGATVDIN